MGRCLQRIPAMNTWYGYLLRVPTTGRLFKNILNREELRGKNGGIGKKRKKGEKTKEQGRKEGTSNKKEGKCPCESYTCYWLTI